MARRKPNIVIDTALKKRDRKSFRNFVLQVIEDTYIFEFPVEDIELLDIADGGDFDNQFIIYLYDKRFIRDVLQVDNVEDYVDIFLYGIRQPKIRYSNGSVETGSFAEIQYISGSSIEFHTGSTWEDANGLKFIFKEEITSAQAPEEILEDFTQERLVTFTIKGKITRIIEDTEIIP